MEWDYNANAGINIVSIVALLKLLADSHQR